MTAAEAGTYTWDTTGPYAGDCITNIIYTWLPAQSQAAVSHVFFKIMPGEQIKIENISRQLMRSRRLTGSVHHFRRDAPNHY